MKNILNIQNIHVINNLTTSYLNYALDARMGYELDQKKASLEDSYIYAQHTFRNVQLSGPIFFRKQKVTPLFINPSPFFQQNYDRQSDYCLGFLSGYDFGAFSATSPATQQVEYVNMHAGFSTDGLGVYSISYHGMGGSMNPGTANLSSAQTYQILTSKQSSINNMVTISSFTKYGITVVARRLYPWVWLNLSGATSQTLAANSTFGTIASGFRPWGYIRIPSTGGSGASDCIYITTGGIVTCTHTINNSRTINVGTAYFIANS